MSGISQIKSKLLGGGSRKKGTTGSRPGTTGGKPGSSGSKDAAIGRGVRGLVSKFRR